jgi:ferredoxin
VPVAQVVDPADAVFSRSIGLDPRFVPTCLAGYKAGIGTYRTDEIEIVGEAVGDILQPDFKVIRAGVGDKALLKYYPSIRNLLLHRPVIDERRCERCYCCQEMCPHRAIERKTPFLGKVLLGRGGR